MSESLKTKKTFQIWQRILAFAILAAAIVVFGRFSGFMRGYGVLLVLLGGAALALISYSVPEIAAAFRNAAGGTAVRPAVRTSALFWDSMARNFWMMGVLASVLSFVNALNDISLSGKGGIAAVASAMAASLLPSVFGLILAAVCFVPAWKLAGEARLQAMESGPAKLLQTSPEAARRSVPETVAGYVLFLGMIAWTVVRPFLSAPALPFKTWTWVFYGPAILIVLGGTTAFVLYAGRTAAGPPLTASFALTALAGSLAGLVQVLLGFASKNIQEVTSAMTFTISSCFVGLLGILLAGAPWEDRMAKAGRIEKPSALSRAAWYIFPLVTLIFLFITFLLIITPIKV
jgi:hypothetical protein